MKVKSCWLEKKNGKQKLLVLFPMKIIIKVITKKVAGYNLECDVRKSSSMLHVIFPYVPGYHEHSVRFGDERT